MSVSLVATSVSALENKLYLENVLSSDIKGKLGVIGPGKSLIIKDPVILQKLEEKHSLGRKLGKLAYYEKVKQGGLDGHMVADSPSYIWRAFWGSDRETKENNQIMSRNKNNNYNQVPIIPYVEGWNSGVSDRVTASGVRASRDLSTAIGIDRYTTVTPYQHVINLWPELKKASTGFRNSGSAHSRYLALRAGKGPFRLLAVVNRMDMSGNLPRGSGTFGAVDPRAFGEIHLIYGLIDRDYEQKTGTAYPHTIQVTYRLPPLNSDYKPTVQETNGLGSSGKASRHEYYMTAEGLSEWRVINQRWARLWRQLSRLNLRNDKQKMADHLHGILLRSATPNNFLNFNSNSKVGGFYNTSKKKIERGENELKAYYANQDSHSLFPTNGERDAYRCMVNTGFLRNLINQYMVDYPADGVYFKTSVQDLLVFNRFYNPALNNYYGKNAYVIANQTGNRYSHVALNGESNGYMTKTNLPGCSHSDHGKTPYQMFQNNRIQNVMPRIMRTKWSFAWDFPKRSDLPSVSEKARHAFAIRTCSGCHGKETRADGFHVMNRLDGRVAPTSDFLKVVGVKTLEIVKGVRYEYKTIQHRKDWLYRSIEVKEQLKPGFGLVRKGDKRI